MCGRDARRVISVPRLTQVSSRVALAHEQAEKSRYEPEVVRRGPETGRLPSERVNPKLEKLVGKGSARELRVTPHPASRVHRH